MTDEELLEIFSEPGTTRAEALRAVYREGYDNGFEDGSGRFD